jgi:peptide deformylase
MILSIVYYDNHELRTRSEKVKEITPEIKQLVYDMIETMDANNGVGLAAVQVGKYLRIIVIRPVLRNEEDDAVLGEVEVYINPKLTHPSEKTEIMPEGCLSIPGLHLEVERPFSIHVEALDIHGKAISKSFSGFHARQIMHENDHLNGVLFIDRLTAKKRKEIEPGLKAIKSKYN